MNKKSYTVVYAPGSGGNFVKALMASYIVEMNRLFYVNELGVPEYYSNLNIDLQNKIPIKLTHEFDFDNYKPTVDHKLVTISYQDSEVGLLAKLNYIKYMKPNLENPELRQKLLDHHKNSWYINHVISLSEEEREKFFDGKELLTDYWDIRKHSAKFDFIISFDTLINNADETNRLVAQFLNSPPYPMLKYNIECWQSITKSHIDGSR